MKTVCASSVLFGQEAFATLGEVSVVADRDLARRHLQDAQALVTRSKTRVDEALVQGTPLRFAGTATAGFDHMDTAALERAGIHWTAAPGCNATSVADWWTACVLELAHRRGETLAGKTLLVVGVGQVGSRVQRRAEALGLRVLLNDPPRAEREGSQLFRDLGDALPEADIVTLHTPLEREGPHATWDLVDRALLQRMKRGCWFINASRGEIVDEDDLLAAMEEGIVSACALDVWNQEPCVRGDLLSRVDLATPHIAGYSFDGKLRGTDMIYRALCARLNREPCWESSSHLPPPDCPEMELNPLSMTREELLRNLVKRVYDIVADDRALREDLADDTDAIAARFEELRKNYPIRREFSGTRVSLLTADADLSACLVSLGFSLASVDHATVAR